MAIVQARSVGKPAEHAGTVRLAGTN